MCQRVFRNSKNLPCVCVSRHGIGKTNVVITSTHWNLVVGLVNTSSGYLNWSLKKSTVSQVVMHCLLVISSHSWVFCIHVYKSAENLFVFWGWTKDIRGIIYCSAPKTKQIMVPPCKQTSPVWCVPAVPCNLLSFMGVLVSYFFFFFFGEVAVETQKTQPLILSTQSTQAGISAMFNEGNAWVISCSFALHGSNEQLCLFIERCAYNDFFNLNATAISGKYFCYLGNCWGCEST